MGHASVRPATSNVPDAANKPIQKVKLVNATICATSRAVKSHVRNLMHTMFERARFWEMVRENPIDLVHQSQGRLKKPRVLDAFVNLTWLTLII